MIIDDKTNSILGINYIGSYAIKCIKSPSSRHVSTASSIYPIRDIDHKNIDQRFKYGIYQAGKN
ncbi:hypothetical protein BpHYR1_007056 [Brachionus plicatilis]|uniref:Uncharacterized protein n=1 Tax=Brachionus plicatilis TaxID=10195 RepID=A0A3M7R183_BRAPC|nr:hypothetical protein BpHYR1_007056 [Brachionus plicatilis]